MQALMNHLPETDNASLHLHIFVLQLPLMFVNRLKPR